jgi:putative ABC transport system permease protein
METLLRDVRYTFVMMRRTRAFTAAALATLALGIGATVAVFSVVYGVLLRPLPYPNADRLVRLSEEHPGALSPLRQAMLSNLTFHAWSKAPHTIDLLAAYRGFEYLVTLPGGAARLAGAGVTPSLFQVIGESAALGRVFRSEEGRTGDQTYVLLSDRAWRQYFNADASIVGRSAMIDGKPYDIVGVMKPGFFFPDRDTLLWVPMSVLEPAPDVVAGRQGRMSVVNAIARLAAGATPLQAEAEGTAAARATVRPMAANLLFGVGGPPVVHARSILAEMTSRVRPALLVLSAGVLCVLLIACANVANLFLSRGVARRREVTVRAAIGASRARLVRQLLTESAVFSALGGGLGLLLAATLVRAVPLLASRSFPRLDDIGIDGPTLAFTTVSALATTLIAGLAPALRSACVELAGSLRGGDGTTASGFLGRSGKRLRDGLLVAEAAFAVLLLVGAMLLARSFVRLIRVDAGYTAQHVLIAEVFIPRLDLFEQNATSNSIVSGIVERARAMPGVIAAGAGNMMPLDNRTMLSGYPAPWAPPGADRPTARSVTYIVTPGYAESLGLRLRAGRLFTESDVSGGPVPWVVNEEFARQYLPQQPVGYQWQTTVGDSNTTKTNVIVGVVANVLKDGNDAAVQTETYQLARDSDLHRFFDRFEVAVRTTGDPAAAAPVLRDVVRGAAPDAAAETITLSERVSASVDQPRFAMTILLAFAALALALASVGLYGVLSYSVSQRTRELGIRAALGASRPDLIGLVIRNGLGVTAFGLALGMIGAAALTRLMRAALFGVTPLDPISFLAAPLLLLLVALAACWLPAARAASIDPSDALRNDQ